MSFNFTNLHEIYSNYSIVQKCRLYSKKIIYVCSKFRICHLNMLSCNENNAFLIEISLNIMKLGIFQLGLIQLDHMEHIFNPNDVLSRLISSTSWCNKGAQQYYKITVVFSKHRRRRNFGWMSLSGCFLISQQICINNKIHKDIFDLTPSVPSVTFIMWENRFLSNVNIHKNHER